MKQFKDPEVQKHMKEARKIALTLDPGKPITEKVIQKEQGAYYKLMNLVLKGTDVIDLMSYPKRTGKGF